MTGEGTILALDVGAKRIGLALASSIARIAHPYTTHENDDSFLEALKKVIDQESVTQLVIGLPRDLNGNETAQTRRIRSFVEEIKSTVNLPITLQDEALTSVQAEKELASRGKLYSKGEIDALAATYILEDYIQTLTS